MKIMNFKIFKWEKYRSLYSVEMVPRRRLELPHPKRALGPEPSASTNSAIWAFATIAAFG